MAILRQKGVKFNNVKTAGIEKAAWPLILAGQKGPDEDGGVINAVDIDWNEAELPSSAPAELPVTIDTTGDLINALAFVNDLAENAAEDAANALSYVNANTIVIDELSSLSADVDDLKDQVYGTNEQQPLRQTVNSLSGSMSTISSTQEDLTEVIHVIANKVNELTSYINSLHNMNLSLINTNDF